ncbi:MAG: CerR family C-terminal domain-containing protein [Paracoccaceae bacterium]
MTATTTPAPEGTRLALIEAGIALFGQQGFAGASTRALSAHAKTNIASIAYHFGGKEGLRLACAEEIARRIQGVFSTPGPMPSTADEARVTLHVLLDRMVAYVVSGEQAGAMVPFILRELTEGGNALDVIYDHLVAPVHGRLCELWALATGSPADSETVKLTVFSLIGQIVYFRIGARVVVRRMDWPVIGPAEAKAISALLTGNLDRLLGPTRRG